MFYARITTEMKCFS